MGVRRTNRVQGGADPSEERGDAGSPLRPISSHDLINFIHHHVVELLTVFYLIYVVLGTLLPFDFALEALAGPGRSFWGAGRGDFGLPDALSNVALYLPLGALLHMTMGRWFGRSILSMLLAVGGAVTLSLVLEAAQAFSPTRVSSAVDVVANSLGACGGVFIWALCKVPERGLLSSLSRELGGNTFSTVVKAYVWLLVLGAVVPFTPTLDAARLMGSVRSSTLVPFAQDHELAELADQAVVWESWEDVAAYRRDRMLLWGSWFAEALSFGLLGWLLHHLLREVVGFRPTSGVWMCLYLSFCLALLMSVLQIAILSRGFHSTDVLFRLAGAMGGYGLRCGSSRLGLGWGEWSGSRRWRWAAATVAAAVGLILFTGLAPFSFDVSSEGLVSRLVSAEVVPFYSYYLGRFDQVCADFWGKSLRYGFLAVGLWLWWPVQPEGSFRARTARIALSVLSLSTAIEVAQLFILSRVPSVSDLIIACMAASVATIWCQYTFDFYAQARKRHGRVPELRAGQPIMSPVDWLIAGLIPDATCDDDILAPSENPHQQAQ